MTINQMRQLYNSGQPIAAILSAAGLEDADPGEWKRILSASPRRSRKQRSAPRRQPTAAQTLVSLTARATVALVERVNEQASAPAAPADDIPFMGEPVAIDDDGNGLAAGVDF